MFFTAPKTQIGWETLELFPTNVYLEISWDKVHFLQLEKLGWDSPMTKVCNLSLTLEKKNVDSK